MHGVKSNSVFHMKHERSLDFLVGTLESTQAYCQKSRGALRSPQQQERVPCTAIQFEMRADSLASTQEEYQTSTSNSRGGFSQLYGGERDPEFVASSGMDTEMADSK